MTAPYDPNQFPYPPTQSTAARLASNVGFSSFIFCALALRVYPLLPASIHSLIPEPIFVGMVAAAGAAIQSGVAKLFRACIGPVAREATRSARVYWQARKIDYYLAKGFINTKEARELKRQVVLDDLEVLKKKLQSGENS